MNFLEERIAQDGGAKIRALGYRLESLAIVDAMDVERKKFFTFTIGDNILSYRT